MQSLRAERRQFRSRVRQSEVCTRSVTDDDLIDIYAHTEWADYYEPPKPLSRSAATAVQGAAAASTITTISVPGEYALSGGRSTDHGAGSCQQAECAAHSVGTGGDEVRDGAAPVGHRRVRLNRLPLETVDLEKVRRDCPSPRGRVVLGMITSDTVARKMLRKVQPAPHRGHPVGAHLEHVFREALGYRNFRTVSRADFWHPFFTRLKSNGIEVRLLVDGTSGGHPNAINQRLPAPPPPPAMMRIQTVILVIVSGRAMGVDDVRTAFATMGMCDTMARAHGVAVFTRQGSVMRAVSDRVIQGGTFSAAQCQYTVLQYALGDRLPPRQVADESQPRALLRERMTGVNYAATCLRLRRLVHVDDVVSGGDDRAQLDVQRKAFREESMRKYRVQWKEFEPSAEEGRAVGVHINCAEKWWSVCPRWATRTVQTLQELAASQWNDHTAEWFGGVMAWVCQSHHLPGVPMWLIRYNRGEAIRLAIAMTTTRIRYRMQRTPEQALRRWPRDGDRESAPYAITDASTRGWAGARTDGVSRCGPWYWCTRAEMPTVEPCCHRPLPTRIDPGQIYLAEMLANAELLWDWGGERDKLVITDSSVWADVVARGHTMDPRMGAMLVALHLLRPGGAQVAVAHCAGHGEGGNYADESTQTLLPFSVVGRPLPSTTNTPRWSPLALVSDTTGVGPHMARVVEPWLNCAWLDRVRRLTAPRPVPAAGRDEQVAVCS